MDDLLGFLGFARNIAWVYLCAVFVVATGLFIFDRRHDKTAGASTGRGVGHENERKAA